MGIVDKFDQILFRPQEGQPVTSSNFRQEGLPNRAIDRNDEQQVKIHKWQSIP